MDNRSKILVVDDESGTRESLRVLLEGSYQVRTAQRGKEALDLMTAEEPDMVLLDILMPEMGGIEVLRRIREKNADIPVAIVTAYASLENTQEALRLGAIDYLLKPFDRSDVEKVVEKGVKYRQEHLKAQKSLKAAQKRIKKIKEEKETLQREVTLTREYLECLLESSLDVIASTDNEGRVVFCNQSVQDLYGYEVEELSGTPLCCYYSGGRKEVHRIGNLLRGKGLLQGYETMIRHKDGHLVPSLLSASLIRDKKGEVIGALGILRDITEQKRLQERLIQTEKLRALGEMAAGIAHDFNNLLTIILTRIQLLQFKAASQGAPIVTKDLEPIERATQQGVETVRRIREFTQMRATDKALEAVDVNSLIQDVVELTRPRWNYETQEKGSRIACRLDLGDIPLIAGVQAELREVLTNLVFNASEAMADGGTLSISTCLIGRPGPGWVEIRVQDTGVGIRQEDRGKIFDPFFSTKGTRNSGLGLSVSYGIISRLGGTIEVESREGRGSIFIIGLQVFEG